mgnify:CR=1 FL=1
MKVLVTGSADFIVMDSSIKSLERGDMVIRIGNINDFCDVALKEPRLEGLKKYKNSIFIKADVEERLL